YASAASLRRRALGYRAACARSAVLSLFSSGQRGLSGGALAVVAVVRVVPAAVEPHYPEQPGATRENREVVAHAAAGGAAAGRARSHGGAPGRGGSRGADFPWEAARGGERGFRTAETGLRSGR